MLSPVDKSVNNNEVVSSPNQVAFPSENQSLKKNTFNNTIIIRRDSLIFQDSTKVPGTVSPNSRWGFIN